MRSRRLCAKWLHSLGANGDQAFKWSCESKRIIIVKWLYSLDANIIWNTIREVPLLFSMF